MGEEMVRRLMDSIRIRPFGDRTDDFEDTIVPMIGGVIILAFVFVIIPAIVSILLR